MKQEFRSLLSMVLVVSFLTQPLVAIAQQQQPSAQPAGGVNFFQNLNLAKGDLPNGGDDPDPFGPPANGGPGTIPIGDPNNNWGGFNNGLGGFGNDFGSFGMYDSGYRPLYRRLIQMSGVLTRDYSAENNDLREKFSNTMTDDQLAQLVIDDGVRNAKFASLAGSTLSALITIGTWTASGAIAGGTSGFATPLAIGTFGAGTVLNTGAGLVERLEIAIQQINMIFRLMDLHGILPRNPESRMNEATLIMAVSAGYLAGSSFIGRALTSVLTIAPAAPVGSSLAAAAGGAGVTVASKPGMMALLSETLSKSMLKIGITDGGLKVLGKVIPVLLIPAFFYGDAYVTRKIGRRAHSIIKAESELVHGAALRYLQTMSSARQLLWAILNETAFTPQQLANENATGAAIRAHRRLMLALFPLLEDEAKSVTEDFNNNPKKPEAFQAALERMKQSFTPYARLYMLRLIYQAMNVKGFVTEQERTKFYNLAAWLGYPLPQRPGEVHPYGNYDHMTRMIYEEDAKASRINTQMAKARWMSSDLAVGANNEITKDLANDYKHYLPIIKADEKTSPADLFREMGEKELASAMHDVTIEVQKSHK